MIENYLRDLASAEEECKGIKSKIKEIDTEINLLMDGTITKQTEERIVFLSDMRYDLSKQLSKAHDKIYDLKRERYLICNQRSLNHCSSIGGNFSLSRIKKYGISGVSL